MIEMITAWQGRHRDALTRTANSIGAVIVGLRAFLRLLASRIRNWLKQSTKDA